MTLALWAASPPSRGRPSRRSSRPWRSVHGVWAWCMVDTGLVHGGMAHAWSLVHGGMGLVRGGRVLAHGGMAHVWAWCMEVWAWRMHGGLAHGAPCMHAVSLPGHVRAWANGRRMADGMRADHHRPAYIHIDKHMPFPAQTLHVSAAGWRPETFHMELAHTHPPLAF